MKMTSKRAVVKPSNTKTARLRHLLLLECHRIGHVYHNNIADIMGQSCGAEVRIEGNKAVSLYAPLALRIRGGDTYSASLAEIDSKWRPNPELFWRWARATSAGVTRVENGSFVSTAKKNQENHTVLDIVKQSGRRGVFVVDLKCRKLWADALRHIHSGTLWQTPDKVLVFDSALIVQKVPQESITLASLLDC